ncbi:MAG: GGDEF domain-containing protein [Bacillota bacterium]
MSLLLIPISAGLLLSQIINISNIKKFLETYLFYLIIIIFLIFKFPNAQIMTIKELLFYDSIFLLILIFNRFIKYSKINMLFFLVLSFFIKSFSLINFTRIQFSIFSSLLFVLTIFLYRKENKNIFLFLIFYYSTNFLFFINPLNGDVLLINIIIKLFIFSFFIIKILTIYKNNLEEKNSEYEKLKKSFDRKVKLEAKKRTMTYQKLHKKNVKKATTDNLTKTLNKDGILRKITDFIQDKQINKFSIIFFDIDDFKSINDTYGHNIGDKSLKTLSNTILKTKRSIDFIGRYGGDEFIIILKNATIEQTLDIGKRYQKNINRNSNPKFTVSMGISTYPEDGKTIKSLLNIADQGLYKSKEKGKNCISYVGNAKLNN